MLDDALKLTLDKIFPKGKELNPEVQEFYSIPEYKDD